MVKSPAEELINVSGPLPEAFTGTETENRAADAANAIAALTNTAEPDDLDYSGQVESGTSKEGSTRPPSFRTNADGVFITDDTQDSAVETTEQRQSYLKKFLKKYLMLPVRVATMSRPEPLKRLKGLSQTRLWIC